MLDRLRHPDPHRGSNDVETESDHLYEGVDSKEAPVIYDARDDCAEGKDDEPDYRHRDGVRDAHFAVVAGDIVVRVVTVDCICCAGEGGEFGALSRCKIRALFGRRARSCWWFSTNPSHEDVKPY